MQGATGKNCIGINERSNIILQFFSAQKNSLLKKVKVYTRNGLRQNLFGICRTRWLERIDGMSIFKELFVPTYHSHREMKENKCEPLFNDETWADTDSLLKLVTDFSFIVILVITRDILDYLLSVTRKLQTKE